METFGTVTTLPVIRANTANNLHAMMTAATLSAHSLTTTKTGISFLVPAIEPIKTNQKRSMMTRLIERKRMFAVI